MSGVARIAVVGTESTGKSTLAQALAEHFNEPWAVEAVRAFWDRRNGGILASDLPTIARGQIANEEVAAQAAKRVVFCDTDLFTNVFWADELYSGEIPAWMRETAAARCRDYALYLWCAPDMAWTSDPQRCFPDHETWLASAERLRSHYSGKNVSLVEIRGNGSERLATALAAVNGVVLNGSTDAAS